MKINIDQIKDLSIDEIIRLYQLGYRLEEDKFENLNLLTDPVVDPVINFGKVIVSTGYDSSSTNITLVDTSILPDPTVDGPYNLVWWNWTDYPDPTDDPNKEIVRVTSKTGNTITIIRPSIINNYNGEGILNIAQNHNIPNKTYKMILAVTAKTINDLQTVPASSLKTSTTTIDIATSPSPIAGQILTATSPTSATWQNLSAPACFFVSLVASPISGNFPLTVNYNATIIGGAAPYTYSWIFGDGSSSSNPAPSHTFTVNGTFTTKLTVVDTLGNSATSATVITVTTGIGITATGLGLIESIATPDTLTTYNAGPSILDYMISSDSLAGIYNASAGIGSPVQDSILPSESLTIRNV